MRGERPLVKTLVVTVSPEDRTSLLEFLRAYKFWKQYVIDQIWDEDKIPSMSELHKRFYESLREKGFRAHHVKEIYKSIRELVIATKKNKGSKPTLKKLTARLDIYDAKLDLDNREITIAVLNGKKIKLKIYCRKERLDKFRDWKWYYLVIKYDYLRDRFLVYIYFKKIVQLRETNGVISIDLNFDNITIVEYKEDVKKIKQLPMPLRKALTQKIWAERIQKKYNKTWRFYKGVLESIRKHQSRSKNILTDYLHKLAKRIVELADKENCTIILENLKGLRNATKSKDFNSKLSRFAYRRLQSYIEYKALEKGIPVVYVKAKGTSSKCPICGAKLKYWRRQYKIRLCKNCGYIGHRDVIACVNMIKRYLKTEDVPVLGSRVNGYKPDETPRGCVAITMRR